MPRRSNVCFYNSRSSVRCGEVSSYQEGCGGYNCLSAWRTYQQERKYKPKTYKVYDNDHGTLACYRESCFCGPCEDVQRTLYYIQDAEDAVFAEEPDRIPSRKLRNGHGLLTYNGDAGFITGYRNGCRCPECRHVNAYRAMKARLKDHPDRERRFMRKWLAGDELADERRERVLAALQRSGSTGTYDRLTTPPPSASARNAMMREARERGDRRYVPYSDQPTKPTIVTDAETLIAESERINAEQDRLLLEPV